jgi:hypothetical protein
MQEKRRLVTTQVNVRIATILVPGLERLSTTTVKQTAYRAMQEKHRQVTTKGSAPVAITPVLGRVRYSPTMDLRIAYLAI